MRIILAYIVLGLISICSASTQGLEDTSMLADDIIVFRPSQKIESIPNDLQLLGSYPKNATVTLYFFGIDEISFNSYVYVYNYDTRKETVDAGKRYQISHVPQFFLTDHGSPFLYCHSNESVCLIPLSGKDRYIPKVILNETENLTRINKAWILQDKDSLKLITQASTITNIDSEEPGDYIRLKSYSIDPNKYRTRFESAVVVKKSSQYLHQKVDLSEYALKLWCGKDDKGIYICKNMISLRPGKPDIMPTIIESARWRRDGALQWNLNGKGSSLARVDKNLPFVLTYSTNIRTQSINILAIDGPSADQKTLVSLRGHGIFDIQVIKAENETYPWLMKLCTFAMRKNYLIRFDNSFQSQTLEYQSPADQYGMFVFIGPNHELLLARNIGGKLSVAQLKDFVSK